MKNHWAAIVVCIMATSCIADNGPSSGSAGGGGSGGNGAGGTGAGGNGPAGDAFPAGAVSFFNRLACPFEWSAYDDAAGRLIIAATAGLPSGTVIGKPLASGEDRPHTHNLSASVVVAAHQLTAPEIGANGVVTIPGPYGFSGAAMPTPAGVPYRQLLVCKKEAQPKADALPLPAKLHSYFNLDACPSGWNPATATEGRILVALPPQAPADMPFGGDPITSPDVRTHTHLFSATLVTSPHGVSAPDNIGPFYGKNGSYPISGESDPAAIDVPIISLLHCEKQ